MKKPELLGDIAPRLENLVPPGVERTVLFCELPPHAVFRFLDTRDPIKNQGPWIKSETPGKALPAMGWAAHWTATWEPAQSVGPHERVYMIYPHKHGVYCYSLFDDPDCVWVENRGWCVPSQ